MFLFFKQKTAYEIRISDWSSDVFSSYLNDPFVGSLTFIRIYSGTLSKGTYLNSVKGKKEKVGRILEMHANDRKDIDEAFAGDIEIGRASCRESVCQYV